MKRKRTPGAPVLPPLGQSAIQALQPLKLASEGASSPEIYGEDSALAS